MCSFESFPTIVFWGFLTAVWVTVRVLESQGPFSVFLPLLLKLWFGRSQIVLFFFKAFSPSTNPLVAVPWAPITIGKIVTFMFHSFLNSQARSRFLSLFSDSFNFTLWFGGTAKSIILQLHFFVVVDCLRSSHLGVIWWSVSISKSQGGLCISFSTTDDGLCIYCLFVWSNFNFLHNFQLLTQSGLVLYSFCVNLLHSLIMGLIVSSILPHNIHLLFCCVLSILALIWLVFVMLFCAAIRRVSVPLLRFIFLSHDLVFSCELSLVSRLKRP